MLVNVFHECNRCCVFHTTFLFYGRRLHGSIPEINFEIEDADEIDEFESWGANGGLRPVEVIIVDVVIGNGRVAKESCSITRIL